MKCSGRGCRTAVGGRGGCLCRCGGINHGMGRIDWASNPTNSAYLSAKSKAISHVKGLKKISKPKVLPSQGSVRIIQEHIRTVEIVTCLVNDSSQLKQIKKLYPQFQTTTTNAVKGLTKNQLNRLSDHFWCDFFASLVYLINKQKITANQITASVAGKISSTLVNAVFNCIKTSRRSSYGNPLATKPGNRETKTRETKDLGEGLTNSILKKIVTKVLVTSLKSCSLPPNINHIELDFQILALLLCPDPESHKLVWNQCFAPLFTLNSAQPLKNQPLNNIVQPLKNTLTKKNIRIPLLDTWD